MRLKAELRARGMTEAEIDAALRKKKRRKPLEFSAVKSRHLVDHEINRPLAGRKATPKPRESRTRAGDELCTVDFAAERLKLHPKTILRFIREGRLPANRIGKSYRIVRADLEAFAGLPAPAEPAAAEPWITSIVDIPDVSPELAQKWARTVPNALNAKAAGPAPMRAEVIYEPERSHLKIVLVGPPVDTVNLLSLIRVWLDQLTP